MVKVPPRNLDRENSGINQQGKTQDKGEIVGYENSRFNAMKYGILSKYTVLQWEDRGEYEALLQSLIGEHSPIGQTECHLVEELAGVMWRKQRLRLAEAGSARNKLLSSIENKDYSTGGSLSMAGALFPVAADNCLHATDVGDLLRMKPESAHAELQHIEARLSRIDQALLNASEGSDEAYCKSLELLDDETKSQWLTIFDDADEESQDNADTEQAQPGRDNGDFEENEESNVPSVIEIRQHILAIMNRRRENDGILDEANYQFFENCESLERFLKSRVLPPLQRRKDQLSNLDAIRQHAFGISFDLDNMEKLARYETHLDRKFEKTLSMLLKLQEFRGQQEDG